MALPPEHEPRLLGSVRRRRVPRPGPMKGSRRLLCCEVSKMAVTERELQRPRTKVDLWTTKPGTPGGTFMRQFWHAIARSEDLAPGHAVPVRVMSEDYALFRGASGRVQLVAQRCPHRGALMHLGWVENDDIRCVYHGWKYDCSGQCIEAPAEKAGFEKAVHIATFPTAEAFE